ncbi:bifunctional UDP-sugar hydrolase/5'-nucleotidase [Prevotella sp. P2-180]|uniref:bifunctional metallophosphatase/5'-nucleotidase n=1 Tax=Prevotella sp. P2-180 TaxID=2024224 RepID=UPI000B96712B|nr:metallophosphatase [Prevotella sp. P2-180]OYP62198.1 metallophosphatase [Prevotella sp. P2-180]
MKRISIFLIFVLAVSVVAKAQKQIVILHTNDTHSTIEPVSKFSKVKEAAGKAGCVRRATMVKQLREQNPDILLFDSGDFSQGSTFYTMYKGDVEVGLMNIMGYDAATIGNHEFDFGLDNLARLARQAKFPIVCSNCDFTGTPCQDVIKKYCVVVRDGVRIGVFGLTPKIEGLVMKENIAGVKYIDPIQATKEMVSVLRDKERCDIVVCLSHLGWKLAPEYIDDQVLISSTTGIDIVLGGHSHTYMKEMEWVDNAEGKSIPVDQNGKHGAFVGKITLKLE